MTVPASVVHRTLWKARIKFIGLQNNVNLYYSKLKLTWTDINYTRLSPYFFQANLYFKRPLASFMSWLISFVILRLVGRWARKPVNHTSWVAVVTPTDRPKSVRNRCLIELFCGVVCVVTLPFWHFCWCSGFCHRTESDLFLFLEMAYLRCEDCESGENYKMQKSAHIGFRTRYLPLSRRTRYQLHY